MNNIQWAQYLPWINTSVMVISTLLMYYFYLQSARPAQLEKKVGQVAYRMCARYRMIASFFELLVIGTYVGYYFFPLPLPLPSTFPWSHGVSIAVAVVIGIPSAYIMLRGVIDAGEESMIPRKKGKLFGGIYTKIRHPQAMGELPLWFAFSLILNSPFLAIYSLVFIPMFISMCFAEEKDLQLRMGKKYTIYKEKTGFIIPKNN